MIRDADYLVLDVETTGLSPRSASLTELYAARITGRGELKGEFHSMINPGHKIPSFITRLTGISDEMVKDAPQAGVVLERFWDFLEERDVIVGHNLRFDLSFIEHQLPTNKVLYNHCLCTMLLSRRVFAHQPLPSYRLGSLASTLNITHQGAHRARSDVMATIELKQRLFTILEEAGIHQLDELLKLQSSSVARCARLMALCLDKSF